MNWAYLAGFTDGDGCICLEVSKNKYFSVRVRWSQKEAQSVVLDEIASFLQGEGFKISLRNFSVARKGHRYPQRELSITNVEDSLQALKEMLPYLVVKRQRALAIIPALETISDLKRQHGNKYRAVSELTPFIEETVQKWRQLVDQRLPEAADTLS